ncbi:MAG: segregation/condensation protein A [Clostridia bacterium]|nr:segregation/condensation protein A [Clostridia bacterium]
MTETLDTKELSSLDIEIPDTDEQPTLFDAEEPEDEAPSFKLEIFEGPLDLLLALIAKNKVNIYDIPIATILEQYMEYIHEMEMFNMEVASSFIVMASRLMLIKSRMLLPVQKDEEDPRQELVDMLLEYQRAKKTAEVLHEREFTYRGRYEKPSEDIGVDPEYKLTHDVEILRDALRRALARNEEADVEYFEMEQNIGRHLTATRQVSVGEKILHVLKKLVKTEKRRLDSFFEEVTSRDEVVATFLALLELIKGKRIKIAYYSEDYSDCDIILNRDTAEESEI